MANLDDVRIPELISNSKAGWFSFEFYPPKTEEGVAALVKRMTWMKSLDPLFMDFTWVPTGDMAQQTLQLADIAKNDLGVVANMHLTCTNQRVEMVRKALDECKANGVRNIVALRGDRSRGQQEDGGSSCALDLIKFMRQEHGDYFSISVAGYPEGHPESMEDFDGDFEALSTLEQRRARVFEENGMPRIHVCRDATYDQEMKYLKAKCDAGASFIITQMFFDPQVYVEFLQACRLHGIFVPVIPGIMCLNSFDAFHRTVSLCRTRLPEGMMRAAKAANTSDDAFKNWGVAEGIKLCKAVLNAGAPGLHFYTFNQEKVVLGILHGLGLVTIPEYKSSSNGDADAKFMPVQGIPAVAALKRNVRPQLPGNQPLYALDPVIFQLVQDEKARQIRSIELIASENFTSRAVMECLGSALTNKYSEGQPGARVYGGNQVIDRIENLCKQRALAAFGLNDKEWGVNVQPYSGTPANFAVYTALLPPHARVMGLDLPSGGHLSHGYYTARKKISATSIYFESFPYKVHPETGLIDMAMLRERALEYRPAMIVCGASAYPRVIDFKGFREIADEVGALLLGDIAHISGLVAAGVHPAPFEHCDVVTTTTHKSLRGPRSGMIFFKYGDKIPDIKERIDMAVFPALQGGPHNHQIGALAVQLLEVATPEFKAYSKEVVANAKALAEALQRKGYKLASDGTDNHLVLWDLRPQGLTGSKLEKVCDRVSITLNRNAVHGDTSALIPGGARLGTPAMTTRGCTTADFETIAGFLDRACQIAVKVQLSSGKQLRDFELALCDNPEVQVLRHEVEAWAMTFGYPGL